MTNLDNKVIMKTQSILFILLIMTLTETNAQDVLGKWYAIRDNNLTEMIIDKDSVKIGVISDRRLKKKNEQGKIRHLGIYKMEDKVIIVFEGKPTTEGAIYLAMTFVNIQRQEFIELAVNGQNKPTKTIEELKDAISNDTTKLFGNVFYSEKRIQELENLKDPETMPLMDFRSYFKKFVEKRDSSLFMEQRLKSTFHDQIVNKTLIELGYNPLFRKDWENRFFDKYLSDKEVEEIYRNKF